MRKLIRSFGLAIAHKFGARITDHRTGKVVGRAIIFPWRGRIHIIGLEGSVVPTFMAQQRLTYWKQELGFTVHDQPDFEKLRPKQPDGMARNEKQN
jgi:hypothetical protein